MFKSANSFSQSKLEKLIRTHVPDLEGDVVFRRIHTGKFNTSYFVETSKGDLVLRIAPDRHAGFVFYERNMMRQEPDIHHVLLERTTIPIPRVLAFDDSHKSIPRDYILLERLPGEPLSEAPGVDINHVLTQVGQALAAVHALRTEKYGYLGDHQPMKPRDTWGEAFEVMWTRMVKDVVRSGHYGNEEAYRMLKLFEKHRSVFEHDPPSCLLHMDVWGQNILVNEQSELTGLIDWDRALWGDREIEFAVLDYCGISKPAFWRGYGEKREETPASRLRHVFYLLYEMQKYIVIRQLRQKNAASALSYKQQVMSVTRQAFG